MSYMNAKKPWVHLHYISKNCGCLALMALSHATETPVKILKFGPQIQYKFTPNQRSWNVVPLVLLIFLKHPYCLKLSITMMCSDSESRHGSLQPPWWKTTTWNLILNDPILNVLAYVLCLWHWPLLFFLFFKIAWCHICGTITFAKTYHQDDSWK